MRSCGRPSGALRAPALGRAGGGSWSVVLEGRPRVPRSETVARTVMKRRKALVCDPVEDGTNEAVLRSSTGDWGLAVSSKARGDREPRRV